MIENVILISSGWTLEIDRTKTENYVLDTVDFGEKDTAYTLFKTLGIVGLERDTWHKRLSSLEITGWVIADHRDANSMNRYKMRLNRLITPKTPFRLIYDHENEIDFTTTESIRYGTLTKDNNEAFCKFKITGLYRR